MLYLIGLGLASEKDITYAGLEVVRRAKRVFLEAYTAVLLVDAQKLEEFYGREVIVADRELVESSSDDILADADTSDIAFLVVGDPLGATTHTDLLLRAQERSIPTRTIHNASILNAIGSAGLSLYNYGQTVSMVFFTETWRPSSWYDRVKENVNIGLHTLVLLDIKVKEPDLEAMVRGRGKRYEPPRYMTVAQCASQMISTEEEKGEGVCGSSALAIGVARLGSSDQKIVSGTLKQLEEVDMGNPLHSVVLIGRRCHDMEKEYIKQFAVAADIFDSAWVQGNYGTA